LRYVAYAPSPSRTPWFRGPSGSFLDEATAALDGAPEARLYHLMRERVTDTTQFSVGDLAPLPRAPAQRRARG